MSTSNYPIRKPQPSEILGLCILLLGFVLSGMLRLNDLSISTDSTRYLIWGTSLASGDGFVDFTLPVPTHFVMNAPFYSILLAPAMFFFPISIVAAKFWTLLWGAAAVGLFFFWLRRHAAGGIAFIGALWLATNSLFFVVSTEVLSEAPFIAVMLLIFLLLDLQTSGHHRIRELTLLILLGILPLVREVGFAIVLGGIILFLVNRQYRRALTVFGLTALLFALWTVRNSVLVGSEGTGLTANLQYVAGHFVTPPDGSLASEFLSRFALNLKGYVVDIGGRLFYPFPTSLMGEPSRLMVIFIDLVSALGLPLALTAAVLSLLGILQDHRRSREAIFRSSALSFFLLMILFYPVHDIRFLLPLLPLVLFYLIQGLSALADRMDPCWRQRLRTGLMVAGLVLVAPSILADAEIVRTNIGYNENPASFAERLAERSAARTTFSHSWRLVGRWIRSHVPEGAIIASPAKEIALFTGGRRVQELSRTLPPPYVDRILRDNNVTEILSKPLWSRDSTGLLGMLWSYDLQFAASRRFWLESIDTVAGILTSLVHSRISDPAPVRRQPPDTNSVAGLLLTAQEHLRAALIEEALPDLQKAFELAPDQPEVLNQLIAVRSMLGDSSFASEAAQRLFTMPRTTAYFPLVQAHLRALALTSQARQSASMTRSALSIQAARLYADLGYPAVALRLLRDFQRDTEPDFESLLWSSYFAKQTGDTVASYRDLDLLGALDPRAGILTPLRQIKDLERELRETRGPVARALIHERIASFYQQLELVEDALDEMERARHDDTGSVDLLLKEARMFEAKGAVPAARALYEMAFRLEPGRDEAVKGLERLRHSPSPAPLHP